MYISCLGRVGLSFSCLQNSFPAVAVLWCYNNISKCFSFHCHGSPLSFYILLSGFTLGQLAREGLLSGLFIIFLFLSFTQHGPKLSLYLYEMLHDHKDSLTKDEQNAVGVFMTSLKLCGHRCIPPNTPHKQDLLKAIKEVYPKKTLSCCYSILLSSFIANKMPFQQYEMSTFVQVGKSWSSKNEKCSLSGFFLAGE